MSEVMNVTEIFGENAFNDVVMRERLPKSVYKKLKETIKNGAELDPSIADVVAHAMKEWAIGNLGVQKRECLSRRHPLPLIFFGLAQHDHGPDGKRFLMADLRGAAHRPALGVPAAVSCAQQSPVPVDGPGFPILFPEIGLGRLSGF